MKVAITSATKDQLNYAIAVSQGVKVVPPEFASYEAVKDWELPFTLWEVTEHYLNQGKSKYTVSPIKVTRCDDRDGKALLSIDFTDKDGRKCVGSVDMYHLTEQSAWYEVECIEKGVYFDNGEHAYTDDWSLCGQLVDKYPYVCSHAVNRASILSCEVKEEIVRSVLTLLCGQEIEVPDEKSNL